VGCSDGPNSDISRHEWAWLSWVVESLIDSASRWCCDFGACVKVGADPKKPLLYRRESILNVEDPSARFTRFQGSIGVC
jgi:hypothetical protein